MCHPICQGMKPCLLDTPTIDFTRVWETWRRQEMARNKGKEEHLGFSNEQERSLPRVGSVRTPTVSWQHRDHCVPLYPKPVSTLPPQTPSSNSWPPPHQPAVLFQSSISKWRWWGELHLTKRFLQALHRGLYSVSLREFFCHILKPACCCKGGSEPIQYFHCQVTSPQPCPWAVNLYFTNSNSIFCRTLCIMTSKSKRWKVIRGHLAQCQKPQPIYSVPQRVVWPLIKYQMTEVASSEEKGMSEKRVGRGLTFHNIFFCSF